MREKFPIGFVMMLFLLAVALAMDAVALSLASSSKYAQMRLFDALRIAFAFGLAQALMPFFGYVLGASFIGFIASIDHFVAFGILAFLGAKMIKESKEIRDENACKMSLRELVLGATATSIDALAVGVTFSFDNTPIFYACCVIGIVCFVLCLGACYVGRTLGTWLGSKMMILGGVLLICIGTKTLIEHLLDHGFNSF